MSIKRKEVFKELASKGWSVGFLHTTRPKQRHELLEISGKLCSGCGRMYLGEHTRARELGYCTNVCFKHYYRELKQVPLHLQEYDAARIARKEQRQNRKARKRERGQGIKRSYVTTDAFLMSFEWRKLRMQALQKYGRRCMCCGATPTDGRVMHVDHIKPRKNHPALALVLSNLQILCDLCNHGKGNWDETDWRPDKPDLKLVVSI